MASQKIEQDRWFMEEVQPHESSLRSWLRGGFPTLPDVDDIVQESYARLIRARQVGKVGKVGYAKAYLFTTARNAALNFFRRRKVVSIVGVADMAELSVLDDRPGVAETVASSRSSNFWRWPFALSLIAAGRCSRFVCFMDFHTKKSPPISASRSTPSRRSSPKACAVVPSISKRTG